MSTPNKVVKSSGRPGRALAILTLILISLGATTFVTGANEVRLGLDLRGGTSVTLQPRASTAGNEVTSAAIDQAVEIIRQRVNSLGVAESEVTAQGSGTNRQIVISVPGENGRRVVDLVGQTAELRFRQVLASGLGIPASVDTSTAATPVAGVSEAVNLAFANLNCTSAESLQGTGSDDPAAAITACSKDGGTKYILAPAEVLGRQISKASAGIDTQAGSAWSVSLTFNGEGTSAFGALTARVTSLPEPTNQVAIVLDGKPVKGSSDLRNRIGLSKVESTVALTIIRDGQKKEVKVKLEKAPEKQEVAAIEEREALQGASFVNPEAGDKSNGIVVKDVQRNSSAWQAGLRERDVVIAVNRKAIKNVDDFEKALKDGGRQVALSVKRGSEDLFLIIQ